MFSVPIVEREIIRYYILISSEDYDTGLVALCITLQCIVLCSGKIETNLIPGDSM